MVPPPHAEPVRTYLSEPDFCTTEKADGPGSAPLSGSRIPPRCRSRSEVRAARGRPCLTDPTSGTWTEPARIPRPEECVAKASRTNVCSPRLDCARAFNVGRTDSPPGGVGCGKAKRRRNLSAEPTFVGTGTPTPHHRDRAPTAGTPPAARSQQSRPNLRPKRLGGSPGLFRVS